jgi:hypothetical protein
VISRYLVIALAFIVAAVKLSQSAWVEAAGLVCLGLGLAILRFGATRPALKPFAWIAFLGAAISIGIVALRV